MCRHVIVGSVQEYQDGDLEKALEEFCAVGVGFEPSCVCVCAWDCMGLCNLQESGVVEEVVEEVQIVEDGNAVDEMLLAEAALAEDRMGSRAQRRGASRVLHIFSREVCGMR